jgi:protease I
VARKTLKNVRVGILAADGFEQVELTVPRKTLLRHGAEVHVISLQPGRIRGMNLMYPGRKVSVDRTVDAVAPADYDALLVPGGFVNPDMLRQSPLMRDFVRRFEALGRPIATLCHGPWLLASAGLVHGRRMTSWPGIQDDLRNAGAQWEDAPVVRDGLWVSSRGPHDLPAFLEGMVELFEESATRTLRPAEAPRGGRLVRRAAALGLGLGAWQLRGARRKPSPALEALHDLGLALAVGGTYFGKLHLDPSVKVLPQKEQRGRLIAAAWSTYLLSDTLGLGTSVATWLGQRRGLTRGWRGARRRPLVRLKDALLGTSVLAIGANALCSALLLRTSRTPDVPVQTGLTAAPEATPKVARLQRGMVVTSFAHLLATGGALALGAPLRAR